MTKKSEAKDEKDVMCHFTSKNWKEEVEEAKLPVLVDFTATWCGPCQTIAPFIEKIAQEREGTLKVGKLDIDKSETLTDKYGVQGVPTLMIFVDGKVVGESVGSMRKKDIDEFIDSALKGRRPGLPKKG